MLPLHVVQVQHLLKEISCLLVGQVAEIFLVKSVIEDLDVVDSLLELLLAYLVDTLLVIVKDDREQNGAHVENDYADEHHEEDHGVEVSVVSWKHEIWEVLRREEHVKLPIRLSQVVREGRPLQRAEKDKAREEGKVEQEHENDGQSHNGVFDVDEDEREGGSQVGETENDDTGAHQIHRVKETEEIGLVQQELSERLEEADAQHDKEGDVADFVLVLLPVPADLAQLDEGDDYDGDQVEAAAELVVQVVSTRDRMIDQEISGLTTDHNTGPLFARAPLRDAKHGQDPNVEQDGDHLQVLQHRRNQ